MRNLSPINRNFSHFITVVNNRRNPARVSLQGIQNSIKYQYNKYVSRAKKDELDNYMISSYTGSDKIYLETCYAKTVSVKNLKTEIYNNQLAHVRYECQYCMIGQSDDGFDHYLPREAFCEFSILSNNLIPCCSQCNSLKGEEWIDLGIGRNILNLYYDPIPTVQFLFCNVIVNNGTPVVTFNVINLNGIPAPLFLIISNHFRRLHLTERFELHCNSEITNIINTLSPTINVVTVAQGRQRLMDDANASKLSFGNNYWRAILKESLATSIPFLTSIGCI